MPPYLSSEQVPGDLKRALTTWDRSLRECAWSPLTAVNVPYRHCELCLAQWFLPLGVSSYSMKEENALICGRKSFSIP